MPRIGIALSGGGSRAIVFHAGLFKFFAESRMLADIVAVSSVSGGSLFLGLVYTINKNKWPSDADYLDVVLPRLRKLLTTTCLQSEATKLLFFPKFWKYAFSRSNILAIAMERHWEVNGPLSAMPESPEWSINGTTAETGRRFRFKQSRCGDYELGYAEASSFLLSEAMAASAAFPLLIGPLRLQTSRFNWRKRPRWGGTEKDEVDFHPPFRSIHIMDGGVYDNLGMEPFFDVGSQTLKDEAGIERLIISDGGLPLPRADLPAIWSFSRLKRVVEITTDQVHALRVRAFISAVRKQPAIGRFFSIGTFCEGYSDVLSRDEVKRLACYPTNLRSMASSDFDLLTRHGYEVAKNNN